MTAAEVAKRLKISHRRVVQLIAGGSLKAKRNRHDGRGTYEVSPTDLVSVLKRNRRKVGRPRKQLSPAA